MQMAAKSVPSSSKPLPADGDTTAEILAGPTGVLAVCSRSGKPEPDYDPLWAVRAFVSLFPNGCGQAPAGTSIDYWVRVLLRRSDRSHARSSLFVLAMFDIVTRHKANTSAWVQNRMSSDQVAKIGRLSARQFELVMVILKAGHRGADLTRQLISAGPGTESFSYCIAAVLYRWFVLIIALLQVSRSCTTALSRQVLAFLVRTSRSCHYEAT